MSDRSIENVYRRRAGHLAKRRVVQSARLTVPALVIALGAERYAIELSALAEVLPFRGCTAVPGGPPSLLGVMNVRGDIRCLGDLRRMLGMDSDGAGDSGYVVMLRRDGHSIGLKVDSVESVREIDLTQSSTPAEAVSGLRCVKALTPDGVIVIDSREAMAQLSPVFA